MSRSEEDKPRSPTLCGRWKEEPLGSCCPALGTGLEFTQRCAGQFGSIMVEKITALAVRGALAARASRLKACPTVTTTPR